MSSTNASGEWYKQKTKKWLEGNGYHVEVMETLRSIFRNGKTIYTKNDKLGADLIALNDKHTILVNSVKGNNGKENISKHVKAFNQYPKGGLKRWIVVWEFRKDEPKIIKVA